MHNLTPQRARYLMLQLTTNKTKKEIAEEIGVQPSTLTRWDHREDVQKAREEMLRREMSIASSRAFKTMLELLDSNNDMVRYNASKDLMDRSGFKAVDKVEVQEMPKIEVDWVGD